jgi:hypothetical protein
MKVSKLGQLTKSEAMKSARDATIVALSALVPQLLEIINVTDWGEYSVIVSIVVAMVTPLLNRIFNVLRVK